MTVSKEQTGHGVDIYLQDMIEAPGDDNSSEEDDDESSEEEGTPKKVENSIKRKADSASKTPNPEKKAKLVTPAGNQKTGSLVILVSCVQLES
ncbi:histone deacetylase HDT1-like, partial [Phalaenopsis equestris]|uniref:histone deacetylase HDT1-like n=1 Tax=Phalaenopsis equestris TaxID=78828 RepID=UPI0009E56E8B